MAWGSLASRAPRGVGARTRTLGDGGGRAEQRGISAGSPRDSCGLSIRANDALYARQLVRERPYQAALLQHEYLGPLAEEV